MKIDKKLKADCLNFVNDYCDSLKNFELDKVVSYFSNNCSFIGNSTGAKIMKSHEEIFDYFDKFRRQGMQGADFAISNIQFENIGDAILCFGQWNIGINDYVLPARFTLLIRKEDGNWLIIHKHSSFEKVVYPWEE